VSPGHASGGRPCWVYLNAGTQANLKTPLDLGKVGDVAAVSVAYGLLRSNNAAVSEAWMIELLEAELEASNAVVGDC
jgi:hypothetical protein